MRQSNETRYRESYWENNRERQSSTRCKGEWVHYFSFLRLGMPYNGPVVYTPYQCTQLPGTTLHIRRDVIQATVTSHPHLCQSCNENLIYIFSICIEALEIVSSNDQPRTYTESSWIIQPFYMCILKERHPSVAYTCQYQLNLLCFTITHTTEYSWPD